LPRHSKFRIPHLKWAAPRRQLRFQPSAGKNSAGKGAPLSSSWKATKFTITYYLEFPQTVDEITLQNDRKKHCKIHFEILNILQIAFSILRWKTELWHFQEIEAFPKQDFAGTHKAKPAKTMNLQKNPKWWKYDNDSAWNRAKWVMRELNEITADDDKPYEEMEPAYRFGFGARLSFGNRDWDPNFETHLAEDWRAMIPARKQKWEHDRNAILDGWNVGSKVSQIHDQVIER
jgi:hypothetical protein